MYEDDEMMQPLEEEAAAGCNHEMECEIQQSLDELQVQLESSDTEEEQIEQSPIRAELRQQYHALSLIGWRKRQKTINRKLRMKRRIAASKFVSPSLEYGSLNYPDDMDSDNDEQSKIFFNDEPKLYRKLLKWNPETPAPRALKEWRDALNIDFGNDRHLPPLYRFFRIFLNRQLGGRKHKMVRIQHYYGHRLVNYEMATHVECVAPAPSECSDNGSNISFKQWRCEDGVEQGSSVARGRYHNYRYKIF